MRRTVSLFAFACLVACTSGVPKKSIDVTPATVPASNAAIAVAPNPFLAEEKNLDQHLAELQRAIEAPTFETLPSKTQYTDLLTAAKLAVARDQPRTGYEYLVRACDMPQATFDDWLERLQLTSQLRAGSDAVKSLTLMAQRWPEQVEHLNDRLVNEVLAEADALPSAQKLALYRALYAMDWTRYGGLEPSRRWRDFALFLLDQGLLSEAIGVSSRVTDVYQLVAMRADRRFDAVVAAHPEHFEIDVAGERELRAREAASDAAPRSLELKSRVILTLFQQKHYAAMLAETDTVLIAIRSTNSPDTLYVDYYDQYAWFLNLRAYALVRNGRSDEAAEELTKASASGHTNHIDQLINLGGLYCRMGRPKEALAAISRVGTNTSPYGAMQLEWVRLDAAVQLGDLGQVTQSMQYISTHSADAPNAYMKALRSTKQFNLLGDLLVAQLLGAAPL
jgi:tetratricopeptide (TPR) repeat protein